MNDRLASRPVVAVVDDDESVRESLPDLLTQLGFASQPFASAEDFLGSDAPLNSRCLLLDIAMPGMTGPDLQRELIARGNSLPIIFITAQVDEGMRASLIQRGAIACLFKPFSEQQLRAALHAALGTS